MNSAREVINPEKMSQARFRITSSTVFLLLLTIAILSLTGCTTLAQKQRLDDASAHYKLGQAHLNERMEQRAYIEFQKAVELDPDDSNYRYALGHIYFLQGRYGRAGQEFRTILENNPDHSKSHNYLGKVYAKEGNLDAAIEEFRKALGNSLYLTPGIARYNLGLALQQKGLQKEALEEFLRAVRINPELLAAYGALAQGYTNLGAYRDAIRTYQVMLEKVPGQAGPRYQLAWVYLKNQERDLAMIEFSTIVQAFSGSDLADRSRKHLEFLRFKVSQLQSGMSPEQVQKVLGKPDSSLVPEGDRSGGLEWLMSQYEVVIYFEDGKFAGYHHRSAP